MGERRVAEWAAGFEAEKAGASLLCPDPFLDLSKRCSLEPSARQNTAWPWDCLPLPALIVFALWHDLKNLLSRGGFYLRLKVTILQSKDLTLQPSFSLSLYSLQKNDRK